MSNQDNRAIERKAAEIRAAYDRVRAALKADPHNRALAQQASALKDQYLTLARHTAQHPKAASVASNTHANHAAEAPSTGGFQFDPSVFEPTGPRVKPVVMNTGPDLGERIASIFRGVHVVRLAISVPLLIVTGTLLLFIGTGRLGFYEVPTRSMEPTLFPGDRLAAMQSSSYERGDVVIVPDPSDGENLAKRIVGTPGDTIEIHSGRLHVNGAQVVEPYIREAMDYRFGPYRVGANEVFLLGDNRNASDDSHRWGRGLALDTVKGRVVYIYAPSERRGRLADGRAVFAVVPADSP